MNGTLEMKRGCEEFVERMCSFDVILLSENIDEEKQKRSVIQGGWCVILGKEWKRVCQLYNGIMKMGFVLN